MTNVICPKCHYGWYKYYEETEIPNTATGIVTDEEVPIYDVKELSVAVKTPLGYLCRLCRYEWKEDGTPISQEDIKRETKFFRKHAKETNAKIHGCPNRVSGLKCSIDNKNCDDWILSICEIKKQINQSLQGKAN